MFLFLFLLSSILGLYNPPLSSSLPIDVDYVTSLALRHADLADSLKCIDERSKWTIIRSCLVTIVACTWTAIHPNIGAPTESGWTNFKRRVLTMFYALLAPEIMVMWAMKQYIGAGKTMDRFNHKFMAGQKPDSSIFASVKQFFTTPPLEKQRSLLPWTKTHAFFLQMGGLLLVDDDDEPIQVLNYKLLEGLIVNNVIDIPLITEAAVKDKSKGDFVVKSLVFCQTLGFAVQCLARIQQKIHLVELEVVTLAFAVLNIITYVLWWDKPQNVQVAFRIKEKRGIAGQRGISNSSEACEANWSHSAIASDSENTSRSNSSEEGTLDFPSGPNSSLQSDKLRLAVKLVIREKSRTMDCWANETSTENIEEKFGHEESLGSDSASWNFSSSTMVDEVQGNKKSQKIPFLRRKLKEDYAEATKETRRGWDRAWYFFARVPYRLAQSLIHPLSKMAGGDDLEEEALQVPMFYAECRVKVKVLAFSSLIAIVFGLIHFIAWSLSFPSRYEEILWRTTAFILVFAPVFFALVNLDRISKGWPAWTQHGITGIAKVGLLLYIFARLAVLVLAFISLRDLPESAYQEISWTAYIPHL